MLRLRVHAENAIGSDTMVSPAGDAVVMAPTATDAPTLSGTAVDGSRLTVDAGTWGGSEPIEVAVRWQTCDAVGAGCADIDGATASTFDLTGDDIGHQLLALVTASGPGGTTTVELPTDEVAAAPPVNVRAPTIGGIAQPDGQLVAHPGRWTGTNPITYAYAWSSCDEHGEDSRARLRCHGSHLRRHRGLLGHTLRATVTATNVRDAKSVTTAPSKVVGAFSATIDGLPLIGQSIAAVPSEIVGAHPVFTYQWQRCDGAGAACADLDGQAGERHEVTAGDAGPRSACRSMPKPATTAPRPCRRQPIRLRRPRRSTTPGRSSTAGSPSAAPSGRSTTPGTPPVLRATRGAAATRVPPPARRSRARPPRPTSSRTTTPALA